MQIQQLQHLLCILILIFRLNRLQQIKNLNLKNFQNMMVNILKFIGIMDRIIMQLAVIINLQIFQIFIIYMKITVSIQ
jgi:hypothetical protein